MANISYPVKVWFEAHFTDASKVGYVGHFDLPMQPSVGMALVLPQDNRGTDNVFVLKITHVILEPKNVCVIAVMIGPMPLASNKASVSTGLTWDDCKGFYGFAATNPQWIKTQLDDHHHER